jgi:hypothetical protein
LARLAASCFSETGMRMGPLYFEEIAWGGGRFCGLAGRVPGKKGTYFVGSGVNAPCGSYGPAHKMMNKSIAPVQSADQGRFCQPVDNYAGFLFYFRRTCGAVTGTNENNYGERSFA